LVPKQAAKRQASGQPEGCLLHWACHNPSQLEFALGQT
jgi:hypothetical protein